MKKRILGMSSSRKNNLGYLEHAENQINTILRHEQRKIVFIPYAGVTFSYDEYEDIVKPVFAELGYDLESIHHSDNPQQAIENAEAIAVGGGNTFALLSRIYANELLSAIQKKVEQGTPYVGWSAGCNVACPSIRTTNDMPIVQPPSLQALSIIPFQINPHFISGKPVGHNGESREERLAEFVTINPPEEVLTLPEGAALYSDGVNGTVLGGGPALVFQPDGSTRSIKENESFALNSITGP